MKNKIDLVIGDWSDDGHGKLEIIKISSNLSLREIQTAYNKGKKIVKFDPIENLCSDYEDRQFFAKDLQLLKKFGFSKEYELNVEDEIMLNREDFTEIVLFVVSLGNKEFKYEFEIDDDRWNIGGYGLFY